MFRAKHHPSSGAYNCTGNLWFFIIPWKVVLACSNNLPRYYGKPEAVSAVLGS
jgi:hypothetical protein